MNRLYVRNLEQKELFEQELVGQFSDGHWENSRPRDHWKFWCSCEVCVVESSWDETIGVVGYPCRTRYNLASKELLDVIGTRMLRYVRWMRHFGAGSGKLFDGLYDGCGTSDYAGIPPYPGEYYDKQRAALSEYNLDLVRAVANDESYSKKDLIRDLKDIKVAMDTRRVATVTV